MSSESRMRLVCLFQFVVALLFLSARILAAPPLVHFVPQDAVGSISTPNVSELNRSWQNTSLYKLWKSDDMRAFAASLRDAAKLRPSSHLPVYGLSWKDLSQVASGEVVWSLCPIGESTTGFLLLVDTNGKSEQLNDLLDVLHKAYVAEGAKHLSRDISDHPVRTYEIPSRNGDSVLQRLYFSKNGVLGVSDQEVLVQHAIRQFDTSPTSGLSATLPYRTIQQESQSDSGTTTAHLTWFVDPFRLDESMPASAPSESVATQPRLRQQGFDIVHGIGGAFRFACDPYDVVHAFMIYAPGDRRKTARALTFHPIKEVGVPRWLPNELDQLDTVQWDLDAALEGYGAWFDEAYAEGEVGTFEVVLDDLRDEPDGPQVDVRRTVNEQLHGPLFRMTQTRQVDGETTDLTLHAVEIRSPSEVKRALQRLFEGDPGVRLEMLDGHEMWVFDENSDKAEDDELMRLGPDLSGYTFTSAHGYLFVASNRSLLESVLQDPVDAESDGNSTILEKAASSWSRFRLPLPLTGKVGNKVNTRAALETDSPHAKSGDSDDTKRCLMIEGDIPFRGDYFHWRFAQHAVDWKSYEQLREGKPNNSESLIGKALANLLNAVSSPRKSAQTQATTAEQSEGRTDFSQLPPFSSVQERFGPLIGISQVREKGWLIHQYVLRDATDAANLSLKNGPIPKSESGNSQ